MNHRNKLIVDAKSINKRCVQLYTRKQTKNFRDCSTTRLEYTDQGYNE